MRKNILLYLTICISLSANCQINKADFTYLETKIPKEKVQLQVNSKLLLAGEFLYYKTFVLNVNSKTLNTISKVNYVKLINSQKIEVFKHKLLVTNRESHGEFFIPSTLETGHYKLLAYSNWSLNNKEHSIYQEDIYIINPYEITNNNSIYRNDSVTIVLKNDINKIALKNTKLTIHTDKDQYNTREKVTLKLKKDVFSTLNQVSISVRKLDSVQTIKKNNSSKILTNNNSNFYLPELRGEIISGKLETSDNASVENKVVSLTIPDKMFIFKNATTNKDGQFHFFIDQNYTNTNAIIEVQEAKSDNFKIVLDDLDFKNYDNLNFKSLNLDPNIKNWLKQQSIDNQIENAYFEVKSDSIISKSSKPTFFEPNATVYKLDDFNRFKTVKETFIEIIFASGIKSTKTNYEFEVYDYVNDEFVNSLSGAKPLVLVDGILITNNNDIVGYSANKIETVSIVIGQYIYGSKVYNGIVSFKTKNGDFSINEISNKGTSIKQIQLLKPQEGKIYYNPNYQNNNLKRIPDYRKQLLWIPSYQLVKSESDVIFYTSDRSGIYEVMVKGYDNNGDFIEVSCNFSVNP